MKNLTAQAVYNADIYLRLSDDDGDRPESNSIKNQREPIAEFLKLMPKIHTHAERKDGGSSGVNLFRPGIREVLQGVCSDAVNCVVIGDLSRLGRNYTETGRVPQEFADHGIWFIAINDGYDTANARGQVSTTLLPAKNLMNGFYSRNISVKIRSHLEVKKRKDQFVGVFAAHGYLKSPDDKSQLVVNDYTAEVVRDVFRWKLEGMNRQGIADRLDADGVFSPSEYKRSLGVKYISGFRSNPQAKWSVAAVGHILRNLLYIDVMVQGKTGRPNYKIKKLMEKPEDGWIRVPGAHEPIINKVNLRTVSGLLRRDTRTAVQKKAAYPFSGPLFCTDCKQNMIHKTISVGGKKYLYYSCPTNQADETACTTHNIGEALLVDAARNCIHTHVKTVLNIEKTLQFVATPPAEDMEARKIDRQFERLKTDYEQTMRFKMSTYEKFVDHLLSEGELKQHRRIYTKKCETITAVISKRQKELDAIVRAGSLQEEWTTHFKSFCHVDVMEHKILVRIINRIYVYEGNRIEIIFRYQNEYRVVAAYIGQYMKRQATQAASTVEEAV